jgi:hypothetical protein
MVLANDGKGTNVLKDLALASYLILPERLSDQEIENQQVLLTPEVLGEETDGLEEETSLIFYEEKRVLGAKLNEDVKKDTDQAFGERIAILFEKIVFAIIYFWYRIFQSIFGVFAYGLK